jgi:PDZ domain-containing protein
MKVLFKKFKLLIIILSIFAATFVAISIIPTNYDITVPAIVADIDNTYDFEGIDTSNVNVSSVSVYSYYKVSVLYYLEALLNPYAIIEKHNEYINTSNDYNYTSGTIQKSVSLCNSLIAGYNAASLDINAVFNGYIVHSIFGIDPTDIMLGDVIIKCEGITLTESYTINHALVETHGTYETEDGSRYINIIPGQGYNFTVLRNGEEKDITVYAYNYVTETYSTPTLGFNYYSSYTVYSEGSSPQFVIHSPNSFGPSAGLMQSLFIYLAITNSELTKDLHIVGTGTVDVNGKAGSIGGVKAKVSAAVLDNADVFFVPKSNYEEALEQYEKYNTDMKLVAVSSLQDCIDYLNGLNVIE